jgi:PKD repeat protein
MWTNFTSNSNDSTACSTNLLTLPYGVGGNYQTPDYRPIVGSAALSNVSFVDSYLAGRSIQAPASNATVAYCQGAVATALTATASAGCTIVWYTQATGGAPIPTPTPTTAVAGSSTYYVAQQDANGYEGPRTMVTVTINATPSTPVITASGSTSFCTGGNVVLTSSTPMGNVWSNGANTAAITVTTSGSYTVTYTNANGCTATSVATVVNVNNAPVPTVQASAIEACNGDTVTITASTSDTYLWSTGATTQSINVTSTTANVTVLVTNANACNGVGTSAPISITFNANPTAVGSFTTNGNVATFANTSTGATSYSWDFGDMTNSSAAAPIHAYAANGSYTVTLTAINGNCSDVTTFNVNIAVSLDELPGVALSLVPNPATTSFNVALTGASLELVTVIDAFGRTILNSTEATINLNQVANGMYNVVVTTNKGTSVRKLIVNN